MKPQRLVELIEEILARKKIWEESHYRMVKAEIEARYRGELYILESEGPRAFPLSRARRRELGLL